MSFNQCLFALFSIVLVSCSTKPTQTKSINTLNTAGDIPSAAPTLENKPEETKSNQKDVLSYFYEIYPKGSGKPVGGLSFQEKDIKNGYLRVGGAMEGYYVFVLFRADRADWIVEQSTGCGPECEQKFQVYKFENGKLSSKMEFYNLFPKNKVDAHVTNLIKKLPKGHTNENLQSWIRLPQSGTSIDILILEQNPGATSGKVNVYKAGKLDWTGAEFNFIAMHPKKPSPIEILSVH